MRIATNSIQQMWLSALQRQQTEIARTQLQVATGQRILRPSDDPVASAQILELNRAFDQVGQYNKNAELARTRLALEENALNSITDVLNRIRELAVQANTASQSNESRQQIATEMRERLDSLLELSNSKDGRDEYLFSGFASRTEPFSRTSTGFVYNGDQGQRLVQIGDARQIADGDSGAQVFQFIRNGNGTFVARPDAANAGTGVVGASSVTDPTAYTPDNYTVTFLTATDYEVTDGGGAVIAVGTHTAGQDIVFGGLEFTLDGSPAAGDTFTVSPSAYQDVFTTVDRLITAVETTVTNDVSEAVLNNGIGAGLQDLDQAIGNLLDVRSGVGSRLSAIDAQLQTNDDTKLQLAETLSDLQDLDYAEALSRLSLQAFGLEAAQQSFARTQNLSLFNYIR